MANDMQSGDIRLVNEALRSLDARIETPDSLSAAALLGRLEEKPAKRGTVLGFRTVSTVLAAVLTVAVLTVAWRALAPNGAMGARSADMAPAAAAENGLAMGMEPESSAEYALETEEAAPAEAEAPDAGDVGGGYAAIKAVLTDIMENGSYSQSAAAQWANEDTIETKYRLVDIENDGNSVSVLIYDKERGGELMKGFWVQGSYAGAEENAERTKLTVTTMFTVTPEDLENGEFVPVYSDEDGAPVLIPLEAVTVKAGAAEPVYTLTVTVDLESGDYSLSAVLG